MDSMYKYEFLQLKNFSCFKKLINNDSNYKNFELLSEYGKMPFLFRCIYNRNIIMLKKQREYIGYMWITRYEYNHYKINRIIIKEYNDVLLYNGFFNKFPKDTYFEIEGIFQEEELEMLERLGFREIELLYKMKKSNLINYEFDLKDSMEFKIFCKKKDEKLRCEIQNEIFKAKNRIDIEESDILFEENQDYYMENAAFFLLYKDMVIGYGQLIEEEGNVYIVNLGIIEGFRGNGYSSLILKKLINTAVEMGYDEVFLKCSENNFSALNVYKKHGFEIVCKYKMLNFKKRVI